MTDTAVALPEAQLEPYSGVEYVFEPNSRELPPFREYLAEAWERRAFVVAISKADLRGGRSRTVLGELWAVLDPIFQAALYYLLIMMIRGGQGGGTERLTMLVSGIFLFRLTTQIMSRGARSIVNNKGLMLNSTFPRILLPVAEVYKALLDFVPVALVYLVFHVLLGSPVGVGLFLLPLFFCLQLLLSLGLGLVFATLVVFVRDMGNVLDYIQRIFFFGSPILYPVATLEPAMVAILRFNPLFAMFACYQTVLTGGVPQLGLVLQLVFWTALFTVVGFRVFVSNERGFALRL